MSAFFLYADDILLLAPSVEGLQKLFTLCENELHDLGLSLNTRKTVCMRIGQRYKTSCCNIVTCCGKKLDWVQELRYLGIYIASAANFKCLFDNAKKSLYRSFNAVYGRLGKTTSEEVILNLVKSKCLPCLLYGVDVCPLNATERRSLEFSVKRIVMKIFHTTCNDIIDECRLCFSFPTVDKLVFKRKVKFLQLFSVMSNSLCNVFKAEADKELADIYISDKLIVK